ncbi:MAG TPA: SRPBCC domain-containing protein [Planctomycetota bacterium]|nr:SRPBCC domain-containing protein [Planctomycetota bacterium]
MPTVTAADLAARELSVTAVIPAPPERVFAVWTEALPEWWGPHGTTTPVCEMDLRPGGLFRTVMRTADGREHPTRGVFLDVVAPRRIVFTDAFEPGFVPRPHPFFTCIVTFDPVPGARTRYTARALHWCAEDRARHEAMGFHAGWGESLERLVAAVARRTACH